MAAQIERPHYLTTREVRELLGISKATLPRWVAAGRLPEPRRPSPRRLMWVREEVLAAVDATRRSDVGDML